MFRELMLSGLKKQHSLLKTLKDEMEQEPRLRFEDWLFYDERTRLVETNLRRLRRIHEDRYLSRIFEAIEL
ncbi:MAG: hypothetical protein A2Z83_04720 [Omnitrophica bacterium GWA2_52_8]|nr:MAG: hypothetical protein A2Z83_04720 [Omnitrophica bacterium GWA2_52_8]